MNITGHHMGPGWTPERVTALRAAVAEGLSAGQTARRLGSCSRNAVIGKAARLGLSFGGSDAAARIATMRLNSGLVGLPGCSPPAPKRQPTSRLYINQGAVRERAPDIALPRQREVVAGVEPRPWLTRLTLKECAWPVGGEGADTLSCCAPTHGLMYCPGHLALMGTPAKTTGKEYERSLRWAARR